jgi:hypothetical protein
MFPRGIQSLPGQMIDIQNLQAHINEIFSTKQRMHKRGKMDIIAKNGRKHLK